MASETRSFLQDPGIDPAEEGRSILRGAIAEHRPSEVFALFSGGHDSLCASHLASQLPEFSGCVHVNTGIGVEETREFVRKTCKAYGWPLREMSPPPFAPRVEKRKPGIDYESLPAYEAIVLHHGFPGAYGHNLIYNRLKERCLRRLAREHKRGPSDRILLVTGVRKAESRRRMGYVEPVQREGCRVWCAPIANWTNHEKDTYIAAHGLPRNRVTGILCMSGECLCGAFGSPGELDLIGRFFPETAAYIRDLGARARALGRVHWRWGEKTKSKPRRPCLRGQMGLCWSCEARSPAD